MLGQKALMLFIALLGMSVATYAVHYSSSPKTYVEEYQNLDNDDQYDEQVFSEIDGEQNQHHHIAKKSTGRSVEYRRYKKDLLHQCNHAKRYSKWDQLAFNELLRKAKKSNSIQCLLERKYDCIKRLIRGAGRKRKLRRQRDKCNRHRRELTGGRRPQNRHDPGAFCGDPITTYMEHEYTVGSGRESRGIGDLRNLKNHLEDTTGCTAEFEGGPFSDGTMRHSLGTYDYTFRFEGPRGLCNDDPTCQFDFTVSQSRCPELDLDSNVVANETFRVGETHYTVTFECIHTGYELSPTQTRSMTCIDYSEWSPTDEPPTCNALECENPATSEFQVLESCSGPAGDAPAFFMGTTCSYTCLQNAIAVDETRLTISCTDQLTWDQELSDCVMGNPPIVFCPEVEFYVGEDVQWSIPQAFDLEDGQIEMEWVATNEYNIDSNFDLSCGDNQCLYNIAYSATDTSANTVSCDVKVLISKRSCGDLYEYYDDMFDVICANTFEGTECSISCSHFLYQNEGSSTALCQLQDNGEVAWVYDNDEPPYCAVIGCQDDILSTPENGQLEVSQSRGGFFFSITCDEGFTLPLNVLSSMICSPSIPFSTRYSDPVCKESESPQSLGMATIGRYEVDRCDYPMDDLTIAINDKVLQWLQLHDNSFVLWEALPYSNVTHYSCDNNVADMAVTWVIDLSPLGTYDLDYLIEELDIAHHAGDLSPDGWTLVQNIFSQPIISCPNALAPDVDNQRCIPCDLGSYYDYTEETCVECPIGHFQEDYGRHCQACQDGYSTRFTGSVGRDSCLRKCEPGKYSSYGVEPCLPCGRGAYTYQSGQRECIHCPDGGDTYLSSSTSILDCYTQGTCSPETCSTNGNCIELGHTILCHCNEGYFGEFCEHQDPCDANECGNGATCEGVGSRYRCHCSPGYTGRLCDSIITNGGWGSWGEWSSCPTCSEDSRQTYVRDRSRVCDDPLPANGGLDCGGSDRDEERCSLYPCGNCGELPHVDNADIPCVSLEETNSVYCYIRCNPGFESNQEDVLGFVCGPEYEYRWFHGTSAVVDWSDYDYYTCSGIQSLNSVAESWGFEVYPEAQAVSSDNLLLCGSSMNADIERLAEENGETVRRRRNADDDFSIEIFMPASGLSASINIATICSQETPSRKKRSVDESEDSVDGSVSVSVTLDIQFENTDVFVDGAYDNDTATAIQLLQDEAIDLMNNVSEQLTSGLVNGTFTIAIGDEELNADPSTVYSQYSEGCPDGMIASVSICVTCPAGTFQDSDECVSCPRGFYQPEERQVACELCPGGTTTNQTGSTAMSNCTALDPDNCAMGYYEENGSCIPCQPGYFQSLEGQTFCEPCPQGSYQDFVGQSTCYVCPNTLTTDSEGTNSSALCVFREDVCGPGTFISDGECQECPLGYYQNIIDQASCIPCPSIFMSTEETGSSYESDCYLAYESVDEICPAGTFNTSTGCEPCSTIEYQPFAGQQSCYSCPEGFMTFIEGATEQSQCTENTEEIDAEKSNKKNNGDWMILAIVLPVAVVAVACIIIIILVKCKNTSTSSVPNQSLDETKCEQSTTPISADASDGYTALSNIPTRAPNDRTESRQSATRIYTTMQNTRDSTPETYTRNNNSATRIPSGSSTRSATNISFREVQFRNA